MLCTDVVKSRLAGWLVGANLIVTLKAHKLGLHAKLVEFNNTSKVTTIRS